MNLKHTQTCSSFFLRKLIVMLPRFLNGKKKKKNSSHTHTHWTHCTMTSLSTNFGPHLWARLQVSKWTHAKSNANVGWILSVTWEKIRAMQVISRTNVGLIQAYRIGIHQYLLPSAACVMTLFDYYILNKFDHLSVLLVYTTDKSESFKESNYSCCSFFSIVSFWVGAKKKKRDKEW